MSKIILILYVIATSSALILLKLGTSEGSPIKFANSRPQLALNPLTALGITLYGVSFLMYMYLVSGHDLGYIIPITTGLVYIIIFTASYFIFHEVFTLSKVLAITLIFAGLLLLNFKK